MIIMRARTMVGAATNVTAVVHTDGKTFAASVGVQTAVANDPAYKRDAKTILTGFQLAAR
jgi:hypothetical protein